MVRSLIRHWNTTVVQSIPVAGATHSREIQEECVFRMVTGVDQHRPVNVSVFYMNILPLKIMFLRLCVLQLVATYICPATIFYLVLYRYQSEKGRVHTYIFYYYHCFKGLAFIYLH